jgi:hypothetical protein
MGEELIIPNGLRVSWQRIRNKVELYGFHFHDLCYETEFSLFEQKLMVINAVSRYG